MGLQPLLDGTSLISVPISRNHRVHHCDLQRTGYVSHRRQSLLSTSALCHIWLLILFVDQIVYISFSSARASQCQIPHDSLAQQLATYPPSCSAILATEVQQVPGQALVSESAEGQTRLNCKRTDHVLHAIVLSVSMPSFPHTYVAYMLCHDMQQQSRSLRVARYSDKAQAQRRLSWVSGQLLSLTTAVGKGSHKQGQLEAGILMTTDQVACDTVAASGTATDLRERATEQLLQKGVLLCTCPCSEAQLLQMCGGALHTISSSRAVECICRGCELS